MRDGNAKRLDHFNPSNSHAHLADDDVVVHGYPDGEAMSMMARVIWISACDGVDRRGVIMHKMMAWRIIPAPAYHFARIHRRMVHGADLLTSSAIS